VNQVIFQRPRTSW